MHLCKLLLRNPEDILELRIRQQATSLLEMHLMLLVECRGRRRHKSLRQARLMHGRRRTRLRAQRAKKVSFACGLFQVAGAARVAIRESSNQLVLRQAAFSCLHVP